MGSKAVQLRDAVIESQIHTGRAGNAPGNIHQDQPSRLALLAALDAAQLAGNRARAIALIEQIYSLIDADCAAAEQDN